MSRVEGDKMGPFRITTEKKWFLKLLLAILIIYTLWFQYAIVEIPGLFTTLGILLALVTFVEMTSLNDLGYLRYLMGPFILIVVWMISSALFSENRTLSFSELIAIIKYCLPMAAIYLYVGTDKDRFYKICKIITLAVTFLAVSLFFAGSKGSNGAAVLGGLNSNKFSCYINLGEITSLLLLRESKLLRERILLLGSLALSGIAQFMAASRRGVVVYVFLLFIYCILRVTMNRKKTVVEMLGLSAGMLAALGVVVYLLQNADSILVLNRFKGYLTAGDNARKVYQAAAKEIFLSSPLLGKGLGAVSTRVGMYSHSLYFEILSTSGLVGMTVLAMYFAENTYFLMQFQQNEVNIALKTQVIVFCCSMVSILLAGIAVVYIYDMDFYIILGLISSYRHIVSERFNYLPKLVKSPTL